MLNSLDPDSVAQEKAKEERNFVEENLIKTTAGQGADQQVARMQKLVQDFPWPTWEEQFTNAQPLLTEGEQLYLVSQISHAAPKDALATVATLGASAGAGRGTNKLLSPAALDHLVRTGYALFADVLRRGQALISPTSDPETETKQDASSLLLTLLGIVDLIRRESFAHFVQASLCFTREHLPGAAAAGRFCSLPFRSVSNLDSFLLSVADLGSSIKHAAGENHVLALWLRECGEYLAPESNSINALFEKISKYVRDDPLLQLPDRIRFARNDQAGSVAGVYREIFFTRSRSKSISDRTADLLAVYNGVKISPSRADVFGCIPFFLMEKLKNTLKLFFASTSTESFGTIANKWDEAFPWFVDLPFRHTEHQKQSSQIKFKAVLATPNAMLKFSRPELSDMLDAEERNSARSQRDPEDNFDSLYLTDIDRIARLLAQFILDDTPEGGPVLKLRRDRLLTDSFVVQNFLEFAIIKRSGALFEGLEHRLGGSEEAARLDAAGQNANFVAPILTNDELKELKLEFSPGVQDDFGCRSKAFGDSILAAENARSAEEARRKLLAKHLLVVAAVYETEIFPAYLKIMKLPSKDALKNFQNFKRISELLAAPVLDYPLSSPVSDEIAWKTIQDLPQLSTIPHALALVLRDVAAFSSHIFRHSALISQNIRAKILAKQLSLLAEADQATMSRALSSKRETLNPARTDLTTPEAVFLVSEKFLASDESLFASAATQSFLLSTCLGRGGELEKIAFRALEKLPAHYLAFSEKSTEQNDHSDSDSKEKRKTAEFEEVADFLQVGA